MPLLLAYHSLPFGSLLVFFGIYMGVVNNQNLSRYVRFNAMQVSGAWGGGARRAVQAAAHEGPPAHGPRYPRAQEQQWLPTGR